MAKELVVRDDKGRFVPGQSGNAAGKVKGLKNYITHERLMLESALRDYVGHPDQKAKLLAGIDRVLTIAVNSEDEKHAISAMKLLLDRVLPAMPLKEAEEAESADRKLEIIIITNPNAKVPVQAVVDGEFTVIEETPCQTSKPDSKPTASKAAKAPTPSTISPTTSCQPTSTPAKAKSRPVKARKKARSNERTVNGRS